MTHTNPEPFVAIDVASFAHALVQAVHVDSVGVVNSRHSNDSFAGVRRRIARRCTGQIPVRTVRIRFIYIFIARFRFRKISTIIACIFRIGRRIFFIFNGKRHVHNADIPHHDARLISISIFAFILAHEG